MAFKPGDAWSPRAHANIFIPKKKDCGEILKEEEFTGKTLMEVRVGFRPGWNGLPGEVLRTE
jgi:hypothetical protein